MELRGKKAVVTGGVRGLGRSIVEALIARGVSVAVFDIDVTGLEALRAVHEEVRIYICDVSNYDEVAAVMGRYHDENGAADIVVNNAGILYSEPLIRLTPSGLARHDVAAWNRVLSTNLSSVFFMAVCAVEKMIATRAKGVVVNISSVSASGNAGQSAYAAAKAGVNALTATWARELGAMGIRTVAVAPGFTETESTRKALTESVLQETVRKVPLRRLGRPEEIAQGVISVIENDFFNGKVLELDGGLVL